METSVDTKLLNSIWMIFWIVQIMNMTWSNNEYKGLNLIEVSYQIT